MTIGLLVDEGKLEWDKPIKDYIPDFQMYNDILTNHITIRDVLSHRTGLPEHGWASFRRLSRKDCVAALRYLEPNHEIRVKHQYNNKMFMLPAYLLECITLFFFLNIKLDLLCFLRKNHLQWYAL